MLKQLRRTVVWGLLVAIVTLALFVSPVFAEEGHAGHGAAGGVMSGGLLWWGLVSLAGIFGFMFLSRFLLVRRQVAAAVTTSGENLGYVAAVRQFSRNAKLFLTYSILADLGGGIWGVLFNLYLLRMDYPVTFIGTFWLINMVCHGTASLPAGIISDRYGRRRSFFIATFISLTAQVTLLFTQAPVGILVLAGIAGFGEAFHGVVGAPFMMENSEPRERTHLFSLNAAFLQSSRFGGSMVGGFLPLMWAAVLGVPNVDPSAARWALVVGPPLTFMALIPLVFMREKRVELPPTFKELLDFRNLPNRRIIAQLAFLGVLTGAASLGLTIRFFNVFFEDAHGASDGQIGTILGLGAVAGAGAVLISPLVAQRWGKVRAIVFTQVASTPFLLMMALVPSLSAVTALFLMRGAVYSLAGPLRNQLSMEMVTSRERGTTAGFTHMAFDLGGGVGAGIAGVVIMAGGYTTAFVAAIALVLVAAALYYVFFIKVEAGVQARVGARLAAPAGGSS